MEEIERTLRENFRGHPEFITMTLDELRLHSEKNYDYAREGPALGNFLRVAAILKQYPGLDPGDPAVVAVTYMLKQLDAFLWMKSGGYEGDVETRDVRLRDVHVYAKLARILDSEGPEYRIDDLFASLRELVQRWTENRDRFMREVEETVGPRKRAAEVSADAWLLAITQLELLLEKEAVDDCL